MSSLLRVAVRALQLDMDKHVFFSWLAEVHLRKQTHGVQVPNVPSLAMFVQFSNEFHWSEFCYQEVLSLGDTSGIHFTDFLRLHHDARSLRGSSPAHPILLDDDTVEDVTEDSGDSRPWSYSYRTSDESSIIRTQLDAQSDVFFSASQGSCTPPK